MEVTKIAGISIKVHPTFLLILGMYGVLGLFTQALIVFSLVIGHEFAHLCTARAYGYKVNGLELFPFGGAAYCENLFEGKKSEESIIALAGPVFNIILLFFAQALRWQGWWDSPALENFVVFNFWLAAFNLIPILPLDGGRVVRSLLSGTFGFVRTTKVLAWAGKGIGIIAGIGGLAYWGSGKPIDTWLILILLAGFFWFTGSKEIATARLTFLRQLTHKKEELVKKGIMPSKTISVYKDTPLVRIVEKFNPDSYALVSLMGDKFDLDVTFTETEIVEGMLKKGIYYPVGEMKVQ